jgi:nicotinamidase-related amidase
MNDYKKLLDRDDALLLVVDIQKVMFDLCVEKDRVGKNLEALVDTAATLELPAVFTEHNAEKLGGFEPSLLERSPHSPVLNKVEFGCFGNRRIRQAVESSGKKTILLAGIESHVCIFQTAVQALSSGYAVHVVADAVSARAKSNLKIGLKRMRDAGTVLTSVEMAIFELLGKAATDDFRKMLPVVKRL